MINFSRGLDAEPYKDRLIPPPWMSVSDPKGSKCLLGKRGAGALGGRQRARGAKSYITLADKWSVPGIGAHVVPKYVLSMPVGGRHTSLTLVSRVLAR